MKYDILIILIELSYFSCFLLVDFRAMLEENSRIVERSLADILLTTLLVVTCFSLVTYNLLPLHGNNARNVQPMEVQKEEILERLIHGQLSKVIDAGVRRVVAGISVRGDEVANVAVVNYVIMNKLLVK